MRDTFVSIVFAAGFSAAAWFCLTETLTEMTQRDCEMGVHSACVALQQPVHGPATPDRDQ